MNIDEKQLAGKKKLIGKWGKTEVFSMATKGGYHMIVAPKNGSFETLGVGPHPAVARHIATKIAPDITWTHLRKADHVEPMYFEHLLPRYEALTHRYRSRHGDEE